MNKIILILLSIFSICSYANEVICDRNYDPFLKFASDVALPNCTKNENIISAKKNNTNEICGRCKERFQKRSDKTIGQLDLHEKKRKFIEVSLKEYKKNLINNLIESLKLRALQPTGSTFKNSIKSCKLRSSDELFSNCSASTKQFLKKTSILEDLNTEITNEMAKILSIDANFSPSRTLLSRNAPLCFIPEKDILYITSAAAEEALTPSIMNLILTLDPSKYKDVKQMFLNDKVSDEYDGDISELIESLKSHPILSEHFKSPQALTKFLKSIPAPKDLKKLRDSIYSKQNGDDLDNRLAENCNNSLQSLTNTICSNDFDQGLFNLDSFPNYQKLFGKELEGSEEDFSGSPKTEAINLELLRLCEESSDKKISLLESTKKISSSLSDKYKDLSLESFTNDKFKSEISELTSNLCKRKNESCEDSSFKCKILMKYKSLSTPNSLDSKLASSSNKEVNTLLRSMIGDISNIDPKTKEILIAQGIIPKSDGTIVAQPDIPERKPEFYANEQSAPDSSVANSTTAAHAAPTKRPNNSVDESGYSNVASNSDTNSNTAIPDFSDLMKGQEEELKGFQDEVKRRLMDLPNKKPATIAEAKSIVNKSFQAIGKQATPAQEALFSSRLMQPETVVQAVEAQPERSTDAENRAAVSKGDSQAEKWKNAQKEAALMGMAGAQKVLARENPVPAEEVESKNKDMTTVALNLAVDPKVNLSELFKDKIDKNDSETQLLKVLLRNKNDFLLQIKSMSFKVVFDGKSQFNVLLTSGDKTEAERIRPQLEMFLKKLKT